MTALTDLETMWDETQQYNDAMTARAILENATDIVYECNTKIQAIIDAGSFTAVPTDLKTTLNAWRNLFVSLQADIEANSDIVDIYSWSSTPETEADTVEEVTE